MCGRFTLTVETIVLIERFGIADQDFDWKPRYNIAPTQPCPVVIVEEHHRVLVPMSWGLIPHWSKDKKSGYQMINARAETVDQKRTFCDLLKKKRCLVPSDSFFE